MIASHNLEFEQFCCFILSPISFSKALGSHSNFTLPSLLYMACLICMVVVYNVYVSFVLTSSQRTKLVADA